MKAKHPSTDPATAAMFERAMIWRQRMDDAGWSADDEADFEVWLQADERHQRVFEVSGEVWTYFDDHVTSPELIRARRALLGRVQGQATARWSGATALLQMPRRRLAAGLLAAAVLGIGAGVWPLATQGEAYQSGVGERRIIRLGDGSVVSLDASSRVTVRYTEGERRLTLKQGQARFDVAHDPSRPFSVTARDQTVVATGTAFNIDIIKPEVRVTLIEGKVLVSPKASLISALAPPPATKPIALHAGQALVTPTDADRPTIQAADIDQVTAWQDGKLDFDGVPLAEAVERVNRYTDRKIRVADAKAGAALVYGTFDAGDIDAFIGAVNGFLPVRAVWGPDGVVLKSMAPDA